MKIAYIATGAAGMVCGTCIHDNTVAAAMQKLGHEVALIPTYTPIRTDEESVSLDHVFLGGLNVYLQEKLSFFRHTPAFIDNLLNSNAILNFISKFSSSTNARELGEMTVSILQGIDGHQKKELLKLIAWLRDHYRPDIVHLNHTLLLGFAREMKRQLGVPVVCGSQGEDLFLDNLIEPFQAQAKELVHQKSQDIDALIATSDYYADFMSDYIGLAPARIHKVYLGIKLDGHGEFPKPAGHGPVVVGYLARICPEKGLQVLVEAFHRLWQKLGPDNLRLRVAGYLGKKDEIFFQALRRRISDWGMAEAFEYVGEVDRLEKIAFLNSIDIFSVPTVYKESKGLSILEAMANGVPVVQPGHGVFPEYVGKTGGGLLCAPDSVADLATALEVLIADAEQREALGRAGKQSVHRHFGDRVMAESMVEVYERCLKLSSTAGKEAAQEVEV